MLITRAVLWAVLAGSMVGVCLADKTTETTTQPNTTVVQTTVENTTKRVPETTKEVTTTKETTKATTQPTTKVTTTAQTTKPVTTSTYMLTAYCACTRCTDGDGITASGTKAKQGRTIAVDPRVIPYGTKVIINGKTYIAEDCGGAIKGNRIDVYFNNHSDAKKFGVQYAEVQIVGS